MWYIAGSSEVPTNRPLLRRSAVVLALCLAMAAPPVALAQASSRAVVQPLPDPAARQLADALRNLATNPRSMPALLAAGKAALRLDDLSAAEGFFVRAQAIAPDDANVKAGMASVLTRKGQGLQALKLFEAAELAGGVPVEHLADRGLAYDLVGDNVRAQRLYEQALAAGPDQAVTQRLAISLSIIGDQRAADAALLPLLQKQDLASYRTRAFALAILGRSDEAVSIAETLLPARLSSRLAPYLRYMPRLTRPQQAAAANLGMFPRAAEIGRDDPALAAYGGASAQPQVAANARTADARLQPAGEPLGRRDTAAASPPAQGSANRRAEDPSLERQSPPRPATPPQVATASGLPGELPAITQTRPAAPAPAALANPARAVPASAAAAPAQAVVPAPANAALAAASVQAPGPAAQRSVPADNSQTALAAQAAGPSISVAQPGPVQPAAVLPGPAQSPPAQGATFQTAALAAVEPPRPQVSLEQVFAEFAQAETRIGPAAGAVDITKITPAVEKPKPEPKPAAKPAPPPPPPEPSRHWVQVATGRDTDALAFDWRRMKRKAAKQLGDAKPYVVTWGQTNRLVTGPFPNTAAADKMIKALKDAGVDSFRFTSSEGEKVRPLG